MSNLHDHHLLKDGYGFMTALPNQPRNTLKEYPYLALSLLLLSLYMSTVRYLRFNNVSRLKKYYGYTSEKHTFKDMTIEQAQEIERNLAEWDFPLVFEFGWIVEFLKVGSTTTIAPNYLPCSYFISTLCANYIIWMMLIVE